MASSSKSRPPGAGTDSARDAVKTPDSDGSPERDGARADETPAAAEDRRPDAAQPQAAEPAGADPAGSGEPDTPAGGQALPPAEAEAKAAERGTATTAVVEPERPEPAAGAAAPRVAPEKAAAAPRARGGARAFLGLVLGGVIAAGLGYGLAVFGPQYGLALPLVGGPDSARIAGLEAGLAASDDARDREADALRSAVSGLESRISGLETAVSGIDERLSGIMESIADIPAGNGTVASATVEALESALGEAGNRIERLEARLAELPALLAAETGAAPGVDVAELQAQRADIAELRGALEAATAENAALAARLEATASAALGRLAEAETAVAALGERAAATVEAADRAVALTRLRAALDTGGPYRDALDRLVEATGQEPPAELARHAERGIATLPQLQQSFPEAAREGLRAARRAGVGDDVGSRFGAFVANQLGLRSTEAREGDDPDAVLSRAEAALMTGELAAAVSLVETLPDDGREAMRGWLERARGHVEARAALDTFTRALPG